MADDAVCCQLISPCSCVVETALAGGPPATARMAAIQTVGASVMHTRTLAERARPVLRTRPLRRPLDHRGLEMPGTARQRQTGASATGRKRQMATAELQIEGFSPEREESAGQTRLTGAECSRIEKNPANGRVTPLRQRRAASATATAKAIFSSRPTPAASSPVLPRRARAEPSSDNFMATLAISARWPAA